VIDVGFARDRETLGENAPNDFQAEVDHHHDGEADDQSPKRRRDAVAEDLVLDELENRGSSSAKNLMISEQETISIRRALCCCRNGARRWRDFHGSSSHA